MTEDRARVRQRLANTLFAQIFAGSPRERQGLLGVFLRLIAWTTLAIAPVLVLLTFEVRFIPYHSSAVTWSHRVLIAIDLAGVLLLWRGVLDARRDITWGGLVEQRAALLTAIILVLFSGIAVTFPGERHTSWMRPDYCDRLSYLPNFIDRLSLPEETLIDIDKLAKIEIVRKTLGQIKPYEGERTRHFEERDLSCVDFTQADLRRANFARADLRGGKMIDTQLRGADLSSARLQDTSLNSAQLQEASLFQAQLQEAELRGAQLQGASLSGADLSHADLYGAQLQGAELTNALLTDANLVDVELEGADLRFANTQGADLRGARDANLTDWQRSVAKIGPSPVIEIEPSERY
jgi:uncharacterized protein YjbI with pentapeptide repeats